MSQQKPITRREPKSFMAELLSEACEKNDAKLVMGPKLGASGQIIFPNNKITSFFNCCFDINPFGSSMIARNKGLTRLILEKDHIAMPRGRYFSLHTDEFGHSSIDELNMMIIACAKKLKFPLIVKGADLHRGSCVSRVDSVGELIEELNGVWKKTNGLVIEEYKKLNDFRFLVFADNIVAVYGKEPLHIIGDGILSAETLVINAKEENKKVNIGSALEVMDEKIYYNLEKFGIKKNDIIPRGVRVDLLEVCNVSTGGTPWDCTEQIHPDFHAYCRKIMKALNLQFAGMDILSADISLPPEESFVLEVNASPDLEGYAKIGDKQMEKIKSLVNDLVYSMSK